MGGMNRRIRDNHRVREVEHATFTRLSYHWTTGGMGRAGTTFYKRLASMISKKRDTECSWTVSWYKLSFALLRASIMSIRRTRSSRHACSIGDHPGTNWPPTVRRSNSLSYSLYRFIAFLKLCTSFHIICLVTHYMSVSYCLYILLCTYIMHFGLAL